MDGRVPRVVMSALGIAVTEGLLSQILSSLGEYASSWPSPDPPVITSE